MAEKLAAGPYHNDNVDIGKSNKRRPMITVKATVKLCLDTFSDFTFFIFRLTLNDFEGHLIVNIVVADERRFP